MDFSENKYNEDDYRNLDLFTNQMVDNHRRLGKKYQIQEIGFDTECIYEKENLTNLVIQIIDTLGNFQIEYIEDGHDMKNEEYYTIVTLGQKEYEFRTSSKTDWIDLEQIMAMLKNMTTQLKPEYAFEVTNTPYDQTAIMVFAKKDDLQKAVDEGFPLSLATGYWDFGCLQWHNRIYVDVELSELPNHEIIHLKYYETLQNLYKRGFCVPDLTQQRIYITDLFKRKCIDITIDGNMAVSSNDLTDNGVRCFQDGWGIILAYTLVKEFNGKPSLFNADDKEITDLTSNQLIAKIEESIKRYK